MPSRFSIRGFTLVEMMVVLTVSLLMMTMVVPIFRVTTKTVQVIERKLAVYESARNILDMVESDIQLAMMNEKGEGFSLKHAAWLDTDPFTTASPSPPIRPGLTDTASIAYKQSRRVSDAMDYVRAEGHGSNANYVPYMTEAPGGKYFPFQYPVMDKSFPEAWRCSMRSTLLYQHDLEWWQDYDSDKSQARWSRPEQLADVGQSEIAFIFESMDAQWQRDDTLWDAIPLRLAPGREIKVPHGYAGGTGIVYQRRLGQIKVMDLAISYWDDNQKLFLDLPDNTAVYFFPAPRAVRVTITACDPDKRAIVTLCRMIQIPCGSGDGHVKEDAMDTAYFADKKQPNNTCNALYNRTKYLPMLPNAFNGDGSRGWAGDYTTCTENTIITQDGVKPINWP